VYLADIGITITQRHQLSSPATSSAQTSYLPAIKQSGVVIQYRFVDGLDKMSEGDLYLEVFPRIEKRHRLWSEVSETTSFGVGW